MDKRRKQVKPMKEREKWKGKRWGSKWTRVEEGCPGPTRGFRKNWDNKHNACSEHTDSISLTCWRVNPTNWTRQCLHTTTQSPIISIQVTTAEYLTHWLSQNARSKITRIFFVVCRPLYVSKVKNYRSFHFTRMSKFPAIQIFFLFQVV